MCRWSEYHTGPRGWRCVVTFWRSTFFERDPSLMLDWPGEIIRQLLHADHVAVVDGKDRQRRQRREARSLERDRRKQALHENLIASSGEALHRQRQYTKSVPQFARQSKSPEAAIKSTAGVPRAAARKLLTHFDSRPSSLRLRCWPALASACRRSLFASAAEAVNVRSHTLNSGCDELHASHGTALRSRGAGRPS